MAARKRRALSYEEIEQFLFEKDSENELSYLSSSDSQGSVDYLPGESQQQKTTPENENTNKEVAPVIIIDYDNLSWEDIPPQVASISSLYLACHSLCYILYHLSTGPS